MNSYAHLGSAVSESCQGSEASEHWQGEGLVAHMETTETKKQIQQETAALKQISASI